MSQSSQIGELFGQNGSMTFLVMPLFLCLFPFLALLNFDSKVEGDTSIVAKNKAALYYCIKTHFSQSLTTGYCHHKH